MRRRPIEPLLWLTFSAGGVVAAMLIPILLILFGLAFPLGWLSAPTHADLLDLVRHPITRVVVVGFCAVSLLHAAHRLRYTLHDGLQLQRLDRPISLLCYGGAVAGSLAAAYLLATV